MRSGFVVFVVCGLWFAGLHMLGFFGLASAVSRGESSNNSRGGKARQGKARPLEGKCGGWRAEVKRTSKQDS